MKQVEPTKDDGFPLRHGQQEKSIQCHHMQAQEPHHIPPHHHHRNSLCLLHFYPSNRLQRTAILNTRLRYKICVSRRHFEILIESFLSFSFKFLMRFNKICCHYAGTGNSRWGISWIADKYYVFFKCDYN